MSNIYQHSQYGTLNARLVLYNRRHPHDKVYIITMWVDSNRHYKVIPFYGRRQTWEQVEPDFTGLTKGPIKNCWNATNAYEAFDHLAATKIEEKGYTTNADGISYITRFQIPHASNLVTQMGDERAAVTAANQSAPRNGPVMQAVTMEQVKSIDGVRMVTRNLLMGEYVLTANDGRKKSIAQWRVESTPWPDLFSEIRDWINEVQPVAKPVVVERRKGRLIEW